jgi:flagellin
MLQEIQGGIYYGSTTQHDSGKRKQTVGITTSAQAKSTEKFVIRYRINRASDDAAGLSISEKMRARSEVLHRLQQMLRTAYLLFRQQKGALNETHSILQRMNELAVKASNDTNMSVDRAGDPGRNYSFS